MIVKKKTNNNLIFRIIAIAILSAYALFMFCMLGWALISSFKSRGDFTLYATSLFPKYDGWQWKNYYYAYDMLCIPINLPTGGIYYVYTGEMLLYSVIWVFGCVFCNTFTTVLVAYCCARFSKQAISKIMYTITVLAISIPIIGALPSQMSIIRALNLYDNFLVLPFTKISFVSSYFLVFYAIFVKVPTTYHEAAELDGAGHWTIFLRIIVPMIANTLLAVSVLNFIYYWNDYSTPMMFLPSYPTFAQGLYTLINGDVDGATIDYGSKYLTKATRLAAALMGAIPSILVFVAFREKIMTNVTMGGLKG